MYIETIKLFIDGEWCAASDGAGNPVINPATGEKIGMVASATPSDLDRALAAATKGFERWKGETAIARWKILSKAADLIEERKDEIANLLTQENGKPTAEAKGEIQFCADATRWYAEEGKRAYGRIIPPRDPRVRQMMVKEPIGPALGFAAWNFPGGNVVLKVAAALAAGCSIIVKPADETPATAVAFGQCFQDAGVPPGVLNIVFGTPAMISEHLIRSPIPKKVSLTGSTPVGKLLQRLASDSLKRCTMELGGHAPVIVFDDAKLEHTLDTLVAAKFRNAGQVCTSPTRFYVHANIYDAFIAGFVERTRKLVIGNGLDAEVNMGPLITERRIAMMDSLTSDAVERGAKLLLGGHRLDRKGNFYAPTILRDVPDTAKIMNEEPFGPIVPITSFTDYDDVIQRANALPYGLASYVFTSNGTTAARASNALNAGQVGINHTNVHEAETPFGGVNESGYGSEGGMEGLEAYLRTKFVTEKQI